MKLFDTFSKKAPNVVFISVLLGAMAGVSYAFLIPILLNSIAPEASGFQTIDAGITKVLGIEVSEIKFATIFLLICSVILLAQTYAQVMLSRVSMDVTSDLRVRIYDRISKAPISALEKVGPSRLMAILTADVQRIVTGGRMLPDVLVNIVTLSAMLLFLFFLNSDVFWFVLQAIIFGIATYQIPMFIGNRYFIRSRQKLDGLHEAIRGLIYGAKELKLNRVKRDSFFKDLLLAHESEVVRSDKRGFTIISIAQNYGNLLNFFVMGVVAFIFVNYHSVTRQELAGVIMALLYVIGPVAILLNFVPQLVVARVSLVRVNKLLDEMPEESVVDSVHEIPPWNTLHFSSVEYQYTGQNNARGFKLGPVDLEISKGEITFIVGGNGSGKSTLSKLITMHYAPDDGGISFDGISVDKDNTASYRQCIAAIYSDFYLFDRLLGFDAAGDIELVQSYLKALDLEKKVTIVDGKFSTLLLSDGQKKRLALLVEFLGDKQLYLFDEWAADQDPDFKRIFYQQILPELKRKGKAVVVISHDDRYFDVADKVIVMEDGKVARIERRSEGLPTGRMSEEREAAIQGDFAAIS